MQLRSQIFKDWRADGSSYPLTGTTATQCGSSSASHWHVNVSCYLNPHYPYFISALFDHEAIHRSLAFLAAGQPAGDLHALLGELVGENAQQLRGDANIEYQNAHNHIMNVSLSFHTNPNGLIQLFKCALPRWGRCLVSRKHRSASPMIRISTLLVVALGAVVSFAPSYLLAQAQDQRAVTDVNAVLRGLRDRSTANQAVRCLRQGCQMLEADRNRLADSLVRHLLAYDGSKDGLTGAYAALNALGNSGSGDGEGIAFDGAYPRLLRLAIEGDQFADSIGNYLARDPIKPRAIANMRRIATLRKTSSSLAVQALASDLGEEGLAALHDLYRNRRLEHELAWREADHVARTHGWPRDSTFTRQP